MMCWIALAIAIVSIQHNSAQESEKVYVGNLAWTTDDDALRERFSEYGTVIDAIVLRDRETGRSRGFGFVTFTTSVEAESAIAALNEQELDGRQIKVNLANSRGNGNGGGDAGFYGRYQQGGTGGFSYGEYEGPTTFG